MIYGMLRHMKAELVVRDQVLLDDGHFWEIIIWKTPTNVPPTTHGYKYRLFYGRAGERIIGYDNERGKGDHRHIRAAEKPYEFIDVPTLLADFMRDVEASK